MQRETSCPLADELLRQFEQAVSEYFKENRTSGTLAVPEAPQVENGHSGQKIRSVRFDKTTNSIQIF